MNITIKDLLDAGVHFGHQVRRWNPKTKPYVFDHRQGVSIINLEKTFALLEKATQFTEQRVASGKDILFVGTKRQAQEIIREAATSLNMPYCANRWMGGTLTNFATCKRSLDKYRRYLKMETDGELDKLPGKEQAAIRREMSRMHRNFEGLLELKQLPSALFVIDTRIEDIAVSEARRMKIPVVALVDTNSDPSKVDYPIPGNDDAVKSIRLIVETIMEAIQNGLNQRSEPALAAMQKGITPILQPETNESDVEVTISPELMESRPEAPAAVDAAAESTADDTVEAENTAGKS